DDTRPTQDSRRTYCSVRPGEPLSVGIRDPVYDMPVLPVPSLRGLIRLGDRLTQPRRDSRTDRGLSEPVIVVPDACFDLREELVQLLTPTKACLNLSPARHRIGTGVVPRPPVLVSEVSDMHHNIRLESTFKVREEIKGARVRIRRMRVANCENFHSRDSRSKANAARSRRKMVFRETPKVSAMLFVVSPWKWIPRMTIRSS